MKLKKIPDEIDLKLYPELKMVYGPYEQTYDNRLIIVLFSKRNGRTTLSYPRYLMERKLQRRLSDNEEVDHIDNNKENNNPDNLQILTPSGNRRKANQKYGIIKCLVCGKPFKQVRPSNRFCSQKCRANGRMIKLC